MNRIQQNRHQMFVKVRSFFDAHPGLETNQPRLQSALTDFRNNLALLEDAAEEQQAVTRHVTTDKRHKQQQLITSLIRLLGVVKAYGFDRNDTALVAQFSTIKTDLNKMSDERLLDAAGYFINAALSFAGDLGDFSYSRQDFTDLQQQLSDLRALMPKYGELLTERTSATRSVRELLNRNMEILKITVKPIMMSIQASDAALYNEFIYVMKTRKPDTSTTTPYVTGA